MPLYVNDGQSPLDAQDARTESVTNAPGAGVDITRSIPANTLGVDNESLTFEIWGSSSGADTITLVFGATTLINAVAVGTDDVIIRGTILRLGAASQTISVTLITSSGGSTTVVAAASEDLTSVLALTASDGSNNVTYDALIIRKWAA